MESSETKNPFLLFIKDFLLITAICLSATYISGAIFYNTYSLKSLGAGMFFNFMPIYAPLHKIVPIPPVLVFYAIFAVSLRLLKSKKIFFVLAWGLVGLSNYYIIQHAKEGGSMVNVKGHEMYEDGQVTSFGFLVHNINPELFLAVFATLLLFSPQIKILCSKFSERKKS